jgi:hypothetical protein
LGPEASGDDCLRESRVDFEVTAAAGANSE